MHPGQPPEGAVRQFADVVSLEPQHLQTVEPLERQALDQPNPIPIEVPKETRPAVQSIRYPSPIAQPLAVCSWQVYLLTPEEWAVMLGEASSLPKRQKK